MRALSSKAEFAIVVSVGLGYFVFQNLRLILAPLPRGVLSEDHLRFLLIYEPFTLLLIFAFLYARGWSLQSIGFAPSPKESFIGLGIALLAYLGDAFILQVAAAIWPPIQEAAREMAFVKPGFEVITVVTVSIVNPIFEEVLLCGYVVSALQKWGGSWIAINVSVGLRLLLHLYQGPLGVVGIIPFGLIFAWWYARTGRLWPLVMAHAVFDLTSLAAFTARS